MARRQKTTTKQQQESDSPDFRIAIDLGTTFTAIAFAKRDSLTDDLTIDQFPGDSHPGLNGTQIPSEIWYLSDRKPGSASDALQTADPSILYGYEVGCRLELPESHPLRTMYKNSGLITRPKLLLDESAYLRDMRVELNDSLAQLKKDKIIKKQEDVIGQLMACFLRHTKSVLERDHGFDGSSSVEVTLAVPVYWTAISNAIMNSCLQKAMEEVQFGPTMARFPQIFMVNEAEAAATHVLQDCNDLARGECFILLDCGVGTTDVGIYKIALGDPLRLGEEVIHPKGVICGSSDVNVRMRALAIENLQDEKYLEDPDEGLTVENIVDSEIMPLFERKYKRIFDINTKESFSFRLRGLRESKHNLRLKCNHLELQHNEMEALFKPSFKTIDTLIVEQIELAKACRIAVDKVVLVGGFGDYPALKNHLMATLKQTNTRLGAKTKLILAAPNTSASGVAKGALRRAQNKDNGPRRVPCQSIGILHHVPNDPDHYPAEVLAQKEGWDLCDLSQEWYIYRTLLWLIKALKASHVIGFESMHLFCDDDSKWIAEEVLYASETCVEDYYTRVHPKNKGKTTKFGIAKFDVTHLKERMQVHVPADGDAGSERYEVVLRIELKVIDRHMEFTAFWPHDAKDAEPIPGSQASFDMASAFRPGTA